MAPFILPGGKDGKLPSRSEKERLVPLSREQLGLILVQLQPICGHPVVLVGDAVLKSGAASLRMQRKYKCKCLSSANEWILRAVRWLRYVCQVGGV